MNFKLDVPIDKTSLFSETDDDEHGDFGYSNSYPSINNYYNYKDIQQFHTNQTNFFNITVILPSLPYFVLKRDINVTYIPLSENFEILIKKGSISPNTNLNLISQSAISKVVNFKDLTIIIYPRIKLNFTNPKDPSKNLENDFKFKVFDLPSESSNTKFKIEIIINKIYYAKHMKWKQMYLGGERLYHLSHVKSNKQLKEEAQVDSNDAILDIFLKNSTSYTGLNHYKTSFGQLKRNAVNIGYHPKKPWELYGPLVDPNTDIHNYRE